MANRDEGLFRMIRRNKLLGMWAAEQLGLVGERAEAYSTELAMGTLESEKSDVLSRIRNDFKAASVDKSEDEILRVMDGLWLKAGDQGSTPSDSTDAALVQIARNLQN